MMPETPNPNVFPEQYVLKRAPQMTCIQEYLSRLLKECDLQNRKQNGFLWLKDISLWVVMLRQNWDMVSCGTVHSPVLILHFIFEPTCSNARWMLMHHFPSVHLCVCHWTKLHISGSIACRVIKRSCGSSAVFAD